MEGLVPLSNLYKHDKEATWILFPIFRLVIDFLRVIGTMLVRDKHLLDSHENRCKLVRCLHQLQLISDDTALSKVIKALGQSCLVLVEDQSRFYPSSKSILFTKVHDKVSLNMSPGLVSSMEIFCEFPASKQWTMLSQLSPLRAQSDSIASYKSLVGASKALYATEGSNWLLTSAYINTLTKFAYRAIKNLSTEKESAKQVLQACIVGDGRVPGLIQVLNSVRRRHQSLRRGDAKDFATNGLLDGEAFTSLFRFIVFDCIGHVSKSIEKFSLDRLACFKPFKDKYSKSLTHVTKELAEDLLSMHGIFMEVDDWMKTCECNTKKAVDSLVGMSKLIDVVQAHLFMFGVNDFTTSQPDFKKKLSAKLVQLFPPMTGDTMSLPIEDFWQRIEDLNFVQFQSSGLMESLNTLSLLLMAIQLRMEDMKQSLESTVLRCLSEIKDLMDGFLPKLIETKQQVEDSGVLTSNNRRSEDDPEIAQIGGESPTLSESGRKICMMKMKLHIFQSCNSNITTDKCDKQTGKRSPEDIVNLNQINMLFDCLATQVPIIHTRFSTIINCFQEYSPIFEIAAQVASQTEDAFYKLSEKSIPAMNSYLDTCHTYCRTSLRTNVEASMKELKDLFSVPNNEQGPATIVRGGWWKTLYELWMTCSLDTNALVLMRSGLQKLIYGNTAPPYEKYSEIIEEVAVTSLLDLEIACRDVYQMDFEGSGEAEEIRDILYPLLDSIALQIVRSRTTSFSKSIQQRVFQQRQYHNLIQNALKTHWSKIEKEVMEEHRSRMECLEGLRVVLENAEDKIISDQHGLLDAARATIEEHASRLHKSIMATVDSLKFVSSSSTLLQKLDRLQRYVKLAESKCLQRLEKADNRTSLGSDPAWKPPVEANAIALNAKQSKLSLATIAKLKRQATNEKKLAASLVKEKSSTLTLDLMGGPGGIASGSGTPGGGMHSSMEESFEMPALLSREPPSKRPTSANNLARHGTPTKRDSSRDGEFIGVVTQVNNMSNKLDQFLKDFGKVNILIDQLQSERLSFNPAKAFWDSIKELEDRLTGVIKSKLNNLNRPSTATYQPISTKDGATMGTTSNVPGVNTTNSATGNGTKNANNSSSSVPASTDSTNSVQDGGSGNKTAAEGINSSLGSGIPSVIGSNGATLYTNTEIFLSKIESTIDLKVKDAFENLVSELEQRLAVAVKHEVVAALTDEDSSPLSSSVIARGGKVSLSNDDVCQVADKLVAKVLEDISSHSRVMIQSMIVAMTTMQSSNSPHSGDASHSPSEESKDPKHAASQKPTPINTATAQINSAATGATPHSTSRLASSSRESPLHKGRTISKDGISLGSKSTESPSHGGAKTDVPLQSPSFDFVEGKDGGGQASILPTQETGHALGGLEEALTTIKEEKISNGVDEAIDSNGVQPGDRLLESVLPMESKIDGPFTIHYPKPVDYSLHFLQLEDKITRLSIQVEQQQRLFSTKWNQLDENVGSIVEKHLETFHAMIEKKYSEQYHVLDRCWSQSKQELMLNIEHRLSKFDAIVHTVNSINQDMMQARQAFEDRIVRFFTRMHEIHDECIQQLTQFIQHKFTNLLKNTEQQLEFVMVKNYHLAYQQVIDDLRTSMMLNVSDSVETILSTQFNKFFQLKSFKALEELIYALDERLPNYLEEEMEKNNEILGKMMAETAVIMKNEILKNIKSNNDIIVNNIAEVVHEGMIVAAPATTSAGAFNSSTHGAESALHISIPTHNIFSNNGAASNVNYDPIYTNEDALFLTKDYKRLQQLLKQVAQTLLAKMNHMQKQFTGRYEELITVQTTRIEPRFDFIEHYLKEQHRMVSQKTFSYRKQQQTLAQQFGNKDSQSTVTNGQRSKSNSRPTSPNTNRQRHDDDGGLLHSQSEPILDNENRGEYFPPTISQILYNMPRRPRPSSPSFTKAERFFKTREEEVFFQIMFFLFFFYLSCFIL